MTVGQPRSFALQLEYDGAGYGGSQLQANAPTVQAELERALAPLAGGAAVRVALAGRTDAGVHARGQVALVQVHERWSAQTLQRALNARLPQDIVVTAAMVAPERFDPRRCARTRRYEYRLNNAPLRSPLLRSSSWHVRWRLDVAAMEAAAAALVGEHDFAAFAAPLQQSGASTVRTMTSVTLRRGQLLVVVEFVANAFLPHQVRRMVGALVEVGRGRLPVPVFTRLLDDARPSTAGPAAPPQGLCLMEVTYDVLRFEVDEP